MSRWQDDIHARLGELKSAIRRYLLLEGAAVVVVLLGAWFWLTYLIDVGYFGSTKLELPKGFRSAALVIGLSAIGVTAVSWVVTRVLRPLRLHSLALLLERRFPEFGGRLMSALRSYVPEGSAASMMAERNEREAADRLRDVDVTDVLNPLPLRRWTMFAGGLLISVLVFGVTNAQAMSRWSDAYLRGKSGYWDAFRQTDLQLFVVRQPAQNEVPFVDGAAKHARGTHLTLIAAVPEGKIVPKRVTLTIRSLGRSGDAIDQEIPMTPAGDGRFRHTVLRVVDDLELDLVGGDYATSSPYVVDVVDPPRIDAIILDCVYPTYTGLNTDANRLVPVQSTSVELPAVTWFRLNATTNKPLAGVDLSGPDVGDITASVVDGESAWSVDGFVSPASDVSHDRPNVISFRSGEPLEIVLHDTDGLTSQQPIELNFIARKDQAPVVAVESRGIGSSVTRKARLPFSGTLTDDYALDEAWFNYGVVSRDQPWEPTRQLLDVTVAGERETTLDENVTALDLRPLGLSVGDRFRLGVAASDTNDMTGPGIGRGEMTTLTIVSDDELLALLYDKELNLRQRFERILEEVRATRDDITLARDKATSGDDRDTWNQISAAAEQAVLAIRKNDSETQTIRELFADLRAELVNNRVDTTDMLERIDGGILKPLGRIIASEFADAERSAVAARQAARGDLAFDAAAAPLATSAGDLDRLVRKLEAVLAEMQRRQSYNQLVKELQRLIDRQKALREKTQEKSVDDFFGDLLP